MDYQYRTKGTCSQLIDFSIDENGKLHNVKFHSLTDKKYIDFNNLPSRKVLFCPFEYLYNIFMLCYVVLLTFLLTF